MTLFVHRNAGGRCPCGAKDATCGPPSDVVPADQLIEEVAAVSGPLKKYRVTRNGFETVMKLSDEDAAKLGAGPYDVVGASTIEPVTLADDDGSGDDNGAPVTPDSAAAVMATTGSVAAPGLADGLPGPEPVQPPEDPGDGQEQDGPQAPAGVDPPEQPVPEPQPAPVKAPAKKRTASANKARAGAETKAGG